MEFLISKREFLRGLSRTHAVADRKSSVPILSNVLISAQGKSSLQLAATDLYMGVSANVPAEVSKGGTVALAARTVFDIVKNLPEGDVEVRIGERHAAEIRCGKVRYKIPGLAGEDFPPLPIPGKATFSDLDAELLAELIALTQYGMSSDDTRPHLAGALFEGDGKVVRMVTTDGHRLCKAEKKLGERSAMLNFSMLVPYRGIGEVKKLVEETRGERKGSDDAPSPISIAVESGNAFFRRDGVQLNVKLVDEQFPPYSKVIPQSQTRRVALLRASFVEALRRISLVASDRSGGIRLQIEPGKLVLTSETPEVGEGSEELEVDYAGEPLAIGFNGRYLLDVLGALSTDEVAIELSGELDPGVVKPVHGDVDFVGVIMPMRI